MKITRFFTPYLIFLFVVSARLLQAQTGIVGTVNDSETGLPLSAKISAPASGVEAGTNEDGYFELRVPPGNHTLKVTAAGFKTGKVTNVTVVRDLERNVNVELAPGDPATEDVMELTDPVFFDGSVGVLHAWNQADMGIYPAHNPIGYALLSSSSADVQSGRGLELETMSGIRVRNGGENELAVTLNGHHLNDPFSGTLHLVVPQNIVHQLLYRPGTLPAKDGWYSAGTLELTTRQAADRFTGSLEGRSDRGAGIVGSSSFDNDVTRFAGGGPLGSGKAQFFVGYQRHNTADARPSVFGHPSITEGDSTTRDFIDVGPNGFPITKDGPVPDKANSLVTQSFFGSVSVRPLKNLLLHANYLSTDLKRNMYADEYAFVPEHVPRNERDTWLLGFGGTWFNDFVNVESTVSFYETDGIVRDRQKTPVEELPGTHLGDFGESTQNSFYLHWSQGRQYTGLTKDDSKRFMLTGDISLDLLDELMLKTGFDYRSHEFRFYSGDFAGSAGPLTNNANQYGYYSDTTGGNWKLKDAEDYNADVFGRFSTENTDPQFNPDLDGAKKPTLFSWYLQPVLDFEGIMVHLALRYDRMNTGQPALLNLADPTGSQDNGQLNSFEDLNGNGAQDSNLWFDFNGNGIQESNEIIRERTLGGTLGPEDFDDHDRVVSTWSPRIAFAADLVKTGLIAAGGPQVRIRAAHGFVRQIPEFSRIYQGTLSLQNASVSPGGVIISSNPNLNLQTSRETEFGLDAGYWPVHGSVTYFLRQSDSFFAIRTTESRPAALTISTNINATSIKGLTVAVGTERVFYIRARMSYTRADAKQSSSEIDGNFMNPWLDFETASVSNRLDHHREDLFAFLFDVSFQKRDGPEFSGLYPLEQTSFAIRFSRASGLPYTPTVVHPIELNSTFRPSAVAPLNSKSTPHQSRLDARVSKAMNVGPVDLTAYIEVFNILDRNNAFQVYSGTGLPDDDKFLDSVGGQQIIAQFGSIYQAQYLARMEDGSFFHAPRQVFAGIVLSF